MSLRSWSGCMAGMPGGASCWPSLFCASAGIDGRSAATRSLVFMSVLVPHAAVFADSQAFAILLQLLLALLHGLARLQAFRRRLVNRGEGAMAGDVLLAFLVRVPF